MRLGNYRTGYFDGQTEAIISETALSYYEWELKLYHKKGGLKKDWFWGMDGVPISSLIFEENKRLMGAGTLNLTHVDFPVDIEDRLEVWYKGAKKWEGLVDSLPDPKGGKVKMVPFSQQLEERLVNYNFSSVSYESALNSIISGLDDCDVTWDADFVDTGSTNLFSKAYERVSAKKAVEDIMKNLPNREWGVDISRRFNVYAPNSTVDKFIQNSEDKWYQSLNVTNDDNRIKATRYEIYKKSTDSGETEYVGNVGYDLAGNPYPALEIEKTKRRKDAKFTISAAVTDDFAKSLAYSDLEGQAKLSTSIKMKGFRLDKYDAGIGDYVKCVDDYERVLLTLKTTDGITEITDTVDNWTGNITKYTDDYVSGDGCLQLVAANQSDDAVYDFGEIKRYLNIDKLVFMAQSDEDIGELLQVGLGETTATLWDTPYPVYINDSDIWEMKEIETTSMSFRYLGIRLKNDRNINRQLYLVGRNRLGAYAEPSIYSEYFFDRFQIYTWIRNQYEGNVVQKKYKLDIKGLNLDMVVGDYELQDNQELLDLNRELEKIKEIQQQST